MEFVSTRIPGVVLVEPLVHDDARGYFMETWSAPLFADAGIDAAFVQDNHSRSIKGTLRGLHYQIEQPQGKLVRVTLGEVFDVAVDLRKTSPTFGRWVGEYLSDQNKRQMWIPPGLAHGFLTISDRADVVYKCTDLYVPEHERTLSWNDPAVADEWPLRADEAPLLSSRDAAGATLAAAPTYA